MARPTSSLPEILRDRVKEGRLRKTIVLQTRPGGAVSRARKGGREGEGGMWGKERGSAKGG